MDYSKEITLTEKVAQLSEVVALEIRNIQNFLKGPALFDHISKTLDYPPKILEIVYDKKANTAYSKTIVLQLKWKNLDFQKKIVLHTAQVYNSGNLNIPDDLFNQYTPYHTAIYSEGDSVGVFDNLVCRKSYTLP